MLESLFQYHNQLVASTEFLFRRDFIDQVEWSERLIGLLGVRGVGKTTCLLQYIKENYKQGIRDCLYVTFDNLALPYSSLLELAQDFYSRGGKHLFIDEIHKHPTWAMELKNIYDLIPELRIVFSGSSILKLLTGGVDLSRRAILYHMSGLSFREFMQIKLKTTLPKFSLSEIITNHERIVHPMVKLFKPLKYFDNYLSTGYYPFFLQSEKTYSIKLQSIINYIIENEIPVILNINILNINKIKRFLQIVASNVPFRPNIVKLSEALELNRNTLLQYINLLSETGIIQCLYSKGSLYGALTKPQKILLGHPNHAFCLATGEVNPGSLRESFFVNQVAAYHKIELPPKADFIVDDRYIFEIGGKGKSYKQIIGQKDAYLVTDNLESGFENKIPLWLFGFLY
jgi:predicted AAA+ superfamily ATPase